MKMINVRAVVCVLGLTISSSILSQDFSKEIAEVTSGVRQEAKASWWGFDKADSTKCLQSAINSGVKKLIVDNTGHEWLINPIQLVSDQEIVFADGVVVRAMPEGFKKQNDYLITAANKKNIVLRGEGNAVLMMNKKDYQDQPRYQWSEWRHLLTLQSCENVVIKNLTLKSSGGDGIYIGRTSLQPACKNITIENVICDDHHRQGMSIISVENLLVKNSKFNNTAGTAPQSGIDFEPNKEDELLVNCVLENCEFNENAAKGVDFYLGNLSSKSTPVSISIRNSRIEGNHGDGVIIITYECGKKNKQVGVGGTIEFVNCDFKDSKKSSIAIHDYLASSKGKLLFKDCRVVHSSKASPIAIKNDSNSEIAGIVFDNLHVTDKEDNRALFYFCGSTGYGIGDITGTIKYKNNNSEEKTFALKDFVGKNATNKDIANSKTKNVDTKNLKTLSLSGTSKDLSNLYLRNKIVFMQYAKQDEQIPITFTANKVTKRDVKITVDVKNPEQKVIDKFVINSKEFNYILKAQEPGVYSFDIDTKGDSLNIASKTQGQSFSTENTLSMFRCNGVFYFNVPVGIADIKIVVATQMGETVDAALLDNTGNVVCSSEKIDGTDMLKFQRKDTSKSEIFSIRFSNAVEDYNFKIIEPLDPIAATTPENLLISK